VDQARRKFVVAFVGLKMKSIVALLSGVAAVNGLVVPNVTEEVPPNGGDEVNQGDCSNPRTPDPYWTSHSVKCTKKNCNAPKYYIIADGNGKMNVWTTNDQKKAYSGEGGFSWWKDYVTREVYDAEMNKVLQTKYSCNGADKELSTWLKRAKEVHTCKYPAGEWEHVFGVDNPKASHTYSVKSSNGYTRGQSNSFTSSLSISEGVSIEVFKASVDFKYTASATNSQTWSHSRDVTNSVTVSPGKSVHTWQWKLTCMGFNDYGMFTEKVSYGTNLFTDTKKFKQPTCLPQNCDSKSAINNPPTLV